MNRLTGSLLLLLGVTLSAQAHFVFVVPTEGTRKAQVVFSDSLKPDRAELLKKIAHTKFTAIVAGKPVAVEARTGTEVLNVEAPGEGPTWIAGVCPYGVIAKGKESFLLTYYARALVGARAGSKVPATTIAAMKLDVIPSLDGKGAPRASVIWEGKPLADAEVVLTVPGKEEPITTKTDARGQVKLTAAEKSGLYAIRARHVAEKKGKLDDKEYTSVRTYATCVFPVEAGGRTALERSDRFAVAVAGRTEENPEASKLLADARGARANWDNFPGFSANVEVNVDGKKTTGKMKVSSKGKVDLEMEGDVKEWTRRTLSSMVGHRMDDSTTLNTPCAFADDVTDHPLGRAIRVLNDEFHSSYRIRDRQVIVVNRKMGDARFTITVLENRLNAEKKYLPGHYVVNTWDAKTGNLRSSVTHHNTWQRVGTFDLPRVSTIVTATAGTQTTRALTLSEWKLAEK
jgi:uncharacterized GH25 family protein